ncbi:aldo/keto reductase [Halalkalibacter kiskunsagensis]|uniref:Aldo/keto reductase n=1 Tax=Halalkalibacter kiskunsagensis TaxID=1548599 RepID=A0ABV6KF10_9BACI
MEKRRYGSTELNVSVLGFGGSEIGGLGGPDAHSKGINLKEVEKLLGSALDAGLNVIDTAECYNDSEEKIGSAVSHRRDEYYLFTKCGHGKGFDLPHWDPKMLEMSIDRSLKRLKTDYIDMIHLHTCSEEILQRGEVIDVLQRAKEKGKVRYIGYSGDHTDALYAVKCGAFDSLMTSLNLMDQEAIDLTIPKAQKQGMGVTIKRPIANVVWRYDQLPENQYHHAYWERMQQLEYEFLQADKQESVGTALRFTLSVPGVHTAIVGTTNPTRWSENARLLEKGALPTEQYQAIRKRWKEKAKTDWIGLE